MRYSQAAIKAAREVYARIDASMSPGMRERYAKFDEAEHPRDEAGEFAAKAVHPLVASAREHAAKVLSKAKPRWDWKELHQQMVEVGLHLDTLSMDHADLDSILKNRESLAQRIERKIDIDSEWPESVYWEDEVHEPITAWMEQHGKALAKQALDLPPQAVLALVQEFKGQKPIQASRELAKQGRYPELLRLAAESSWLDRKRYAREGDWITIGGNKGNPPGEKGGTPVQIKGGRIVSGPDSLNGRRMSQVAERDKPNSEHHQAIKAIAKRWRVKRADLRSVADDLWQQKRNAVIERENAKGQARQITGITAADYSRLSNAGQDYTSVRGFDDAARQVASELPELGIPEGSDYAAAVWALIGEGRVAPPVRHNADILNEAAEWLHRNRPPAVESDSVPFAKEGEPLRYDLRSEINEAASQTHLDPSKAQRESGNYRKGKISIQGLEISIENPRGSTRSGKSSDGKEWSIEMPYHYGYIRKTESEADGDHVDVFIGQHPESEVVFIVNQSNPRGGFDEHKCMVGWTNEAAAKKAYHASYSEGWTGFRSIHALTMGQFKEWLAEGDTSKPIGESRIVKRHAYAKKPAEGQRQLFDEPPTLAEMFREADRKKAATRLCVGNAS